MSEHYHFKMCHLQEHQGVRSHSSLHINSESGEHLARRSWTGVSGVELPHQLPITVAQKSTAPTSMPQHSLNTVY